MGGSGGGGCLWSDPGAPKPKEALIFPSGFITPLSFHTIGSSQKLSCDQAMGKYPTRLSYPLKWGSLAGVGLASCLFLAYYRGGFVQPPVRSPWPETTILKAQIPGWAGFGHAVHSKLSDYPGDPVTEHNVSYSQFREDMWAHDNGGSQEPTQHLPKIVHSWVSCAELEL